MGRNVGKVADVDRFAENVWIVASDTEIAYSSETDAPLVFSTKTDAALFKTCNLPKNTKLKPRKARIVEGWV